MRNCCLLLALAGAVALAFSSCVKAPELTVTSPTSIDLSVDGSSSKITFTANRDWTVRSANSWVTISPSSGAASDGPVTVNISCAGNTTYEDRSATITISIDGQSETITVTQPANLGVVLPTRSYDLASDSRSLDVEVQANVQYSVIISDKWIKQTGTKGLATNRLTFSIEENDTYDARSATITIKPQNATVQEQVITVKQAQKDALIVKDTSFDMPYGGGEIEFKVEANVSFDVKPSEGWIHYVETKALSGSTVRLTVDENETYSAREGKIEIKQKNGSLSHTITVKQAGRIAVTSIELNKTSLRLKEGEFETLTATVKPDNATDKTVTWASSNEGVASVDAAGKVSAIKEGTATITAQAGEKTAKCEVTVYKDIPVSSIELDKTTLSIAVGDAVTLKTTVKPADATDKTITWSSNDTNVAKVDAEGKVTAIGKGSTTITAYSGNVSASCKVFVKAASYPTPSGAVDLGLSVVWADKNLGASSAYDAGGYYLWGDPTGNGVIMSFNTPNTNNISDSQYDIAKAKLGKGWRIPTRDEINELFRECTWEAVTNGIRLTGPSGKSVILSLTGMGFPGDGPVGTTSITAKDKGFLMSGDSYADGAGRFAYVCRHSQTYPHEWVSYNAPMAKFPVRPVFESLDGSIPVSSISLNKTSLTLKEGETETLIATVFPADATETVTWFSSNTSVAVVDENGKVTAINTGVAAIIAQVGEQNAACSVSVTPNVQEGNIPFADATLKKKLVELYDSDGDGEISYKEAAAVTDFRNAITIKTVSSFDEFQYFTGLTEIPENCFHSWVKLTSITIPPFVTKIGDQAFVNCTSLANICIPSNVQSIGQSIFKGCARLSSVLIAEGVPFVGIGMFDGCANLSSIKLPQSIQFIGSSAFSGCKNLPSVAIPDKVMTIASYAFNGCESLSELIIPTSVTSIGASVFRNCTSLTSIVIPDSVSDFRTYHCFDGCSNLVSVKLPSTLTVIEAYAFYNCASLKEIEIPDNVLVLDAQAFRGCTSLASVNIPQNVTLLGDALFMNCSSLSSIVIPESVTAWNGSVFSGCTNLTAVTIPESLTYINTATFKGCVNLKTVDIPESINRILPSAFRDSGLTSIELPSSIAYVENDAFNDCTKVNKAIIKATTPPTVGNNAFKGSYPIYVPAGSIEMYKSSWEIYSSRIHSIDEL